jgi:hypothetical protein
MGINQNINQTPIAVRFYENPKFGTTYGPAKYNQAAYNATAELVHESKKYLLDFTSINYWENTARSDEQMECINEVREIIANANGKSDQYFASWVKFLSPEKQKINVIGFGLLDLPNMQLHLVILDNERNVGEIWNLNTCTCREVFRKNAPQLIATNTDL